MPQAGTRPAGAAICRCCQARQRATVESLGSFAFERQLAMKINARGPEFVAIDYTPMIDMTFQLIAFFMILINFSDAEQDQRVQLPTSSLARPPEAAATTPITIQMVSGGQIVMSGQL